MSDAGTPPQQPPTGGSYPPPPGPPEPPNGSGGYAGGAPSAPRTNQLALWSLITGLASILLCVCFGGLLGFVAVPLGIVGRRRINASQGRETGSGLALSGIIAGAVGIVLLLVWIALWLLPLLGFAMMEPFLEGFTSGLDEGYNDY